MIKKLRKYVDTYGAAKAAFILGYKDTGRIRNWLQRNEIPESKREAVRSMFKTKITIEKEA